MIVYVAGEWGTTKSHHKKDKCTVTDLYVESLGRCNCYQRNILFAYGGYCTLGR